MKKLRLLASILLFSVATTSVFADNRPHTVSLTMAGGNFDFSPKRHIENTGTPLGIIGFNFTEHWGLEGLLGFFNTRSHKLEDHGKQVSGTVFAIDGVYHFSSFHSAVPYVLLGPGVIGLSPNGSDANNEGNLNGGLGVEYFVSDSIALRVEARDFYTITGGKNDLLFDGGITFLIGS